jgi:hypothetical protein
LDGWIFTVVEATERQIENIKCEQVKETKGSADTLSANEPVA